MKKKRNFLLIEVLIAILLVSICLIPLIQIPINSYRSEMEWLEEMDRERLAELAFADVKEKLLKNELAWEKIPGPGLHTGPFSLPPGQTCIPGCKTTDISISYTLSCGKKREKIGLHGEIYRMLTVAIEFDPPLSKKNIYRFQIMVRKI